MNHGKIFVAGIGPGSEEDITPAVRTAIMQSGVVVGYKYYFNFIRSIVRPETECIDTGMKKEFEKMAGGQDNLVKENGGAGRLATPQEMADPLLFLNSDMAAFVSGLLLIADMGHNCEKTLGFCKNQLDVPAALKLYNTKFFQNKLKTNQ